VLLDPVLLEPVLLEPVLLEPVLPDPGVVPAALDEPVPGDALPLLPLFPDDELADDEPTGVEGLPAGCAVGLVEADVTGVAFGLADTLAWAVGLPQMVPDFGLAGFLVPVGLAGAVAVGVALLLGLLVAVELPLPAEPLGPAAGLVTELGGELGGELDGLDVVAAGLDELGVDWGEAEADDCEHDASGVGLCLAVVSYDPAPPAGAWPLRPGGAGLVALVPLLTSKVPSKAADTDEVTAWRNGGTEARTTPTANTAQARAMAGLIRPSRQSLGCCGVRRARPALCPL
jgi:hypothetical protein